MKKISFVMIALVAGISFSCGLLDKADVNFDIKLEQDFDINSGATLTNPYTYSKVLDPTSNADFAKYKDKIKDIKVNKITYQVSGLTSPTSVFSNGNLQVDGTTIITQATTQLSAVNGLPEAEYTSSNTAGFTALATDLKNNKSATVQLQGSLSAPPVAFRLATFYYLTVTANALK